MPGTTREKWLAIHDLWARAKNDFSYAFKMYEQWYHYTLQPGDASAAEIKEWAKYASDRVEDLQNQMATIQQDLLYAQPGRWEGDKRNRIYGDAQINVVSFIEDRNQKQRRFLEASQTVTALEDQSVIEDDRPIFDVFNYLGGINRELQSYAGLDALQDTPHLSFTRNFKHNLEL